MNVQIHSKKLKLSDDQKEYLTRKSEKILHYSKRADDESSRISVEVDNENTKDKNHIRCVVNIHVPGDTLHAESYSTTVHSCIDECEEKLKSQIDRYKGKMQK